MTEQTLKLSSRTDEKNATPRRIGSDLIDAVEVTLEGVLGSARMTVAELTALGEGAVIALDAALNAEVELRLNGMVVARGELVTVGEAFAVRLTEIAQ